MKTEILIRIAKEKYNLPVEGVQLSGTHGLHSGHMTIIYLMGQILDIELGREPGERQSLGQIRKDLNVLTGVDKPMQNIMLSDLKNEFFEFLKNKMGDEYDRMVRESYGI